MVLEDFTLVIINYIGLCQFKTGQGFEIMKIKILNKICIL